MFDDDDVDNDDYPDYHADDHNDDRDDDDVVYDNDADMAEHVYKYYHGLFGCSKFDSDSIRWIFDEKYDLEEYCILDGFFVSECARKANRNKISGEDQCVSEHFLELDMFHFDLLAFTFRKIIANQNGNLTESWDNLWCQCIEKVKLAKFVQQYRPIIII